MDLETPDGSLLTLHADGRERRSYWPEKEVDILIHGIPAPSQPALGHLVRHYFLWLLPFHAYAIG